MRAIIASKDNAMPKYFDLEKGSISSLVQPNVRGLNMSRALYGDYLNQQLFSLSFTFLRDLLASGFAFSYLHS